MTKVEAPILDTTPQAERVRYRVLAGFAVLAGLTYLDRVCLSQAIVPMSAELGLTAREKGWVFSAFTLAYGLFEIPTGRLGDAIGPKRVLIRVVLWWSLFTALTGWAWSLTSLLIIRFAFGAGEAGAFPNIARALTRWFPPAERGRAQGVVWTVSRLGGAAAPLLTYGLIELVGWRWTFGVFGLLGLVWVVPFWFHYRDEPEEHPAIRPTEAAWIASWQDQEEPAETGSRAPWGRILASRSVWGLALSTFWSAFGWYFFVTWLPTYLERARGLALDSVATWAGLPLMLGVLGCGLGGWLSDRLLPILGPRWARRSVGVAGLWLGGVCFLLGVRAGHAEVAVLLMALASFANDLPQSGLWAAIMDIGERDAGSVAGVVNTASAAGALISPVLFGELLQRGFGWTVALVVTGLAFFLAGASWMLVDPSRTIHGEAVRIT